VTVSPETTAWVQHVLSAEALQAVVDVCTNERIDVLPVKGVVTGRLLYDDVSERPLGDVDVRVRPRDLGRLVEAGRRAGWGVIRIQRAYANVVFEVGGRMVDVEATVGPPGLCGLTVEAMIARSTFDASLGFRHRVPELHDHALLLCVNVFKDKLVGASPHAISDVERIARLPGFEPRRFGVLAQASSAATLAWIVADWLARERAAKPWGLVREALEPPPRPRYAALFRRWIEAGRAGSLRLRLLMRMAHDSKARRAGAVVALAGMIVETHLRERRARRR
jgi:hypothetical protein